MEFHSRQGQPLNASATTTGRTAVIVTCTSDVHPSKAWSRMWVRESGSITDLTEVHLKNAQTLTRMREFGSVTDVSEVHPQDAWPPM